MSFEICPECAETNYYLVGYTRCFDCGFQGFASRREQRCGRPGKSRRQAATETPLDAGAVRYRLGLLDAAHVADMLATDMSLNGCGEEYVNRCAELARQMRAFAGHTEAVATFDGAPGRRSWSGRRFLAVVRRVRSW